MVTGIPRLRSVAISVFGVCLPFGSRRDILSTGREGEYTGLSVRRLCMSGFLVGRVLTVAKPAYWRSCQAGCWVTASGREIVEAKYGDVMRAEAVGGRMDRMSRIIRRFRVWDSDISGDVPLPDVVGRNCRSDNEEAIVSNSCSRLTKRCVIPESLSMGIPPAGSSTITDSIVAGD